MLGRILLPLALLAASLGGCAAASEERLSKMEADITQLQTLDIRLAILEDAVANISSGGKAATGQPARGQAFTPQAASSQAATSQAATSQAVREQAFTSQPARGNAAPFPHEPPPSKPVSVSKPVPAKSANRAPQEYQTALAKLEAGSPGSAKVLFQDFMVSYPAHALVPNAGYWLGECYYTLKEYDSAILAFKDVVAEFPAHNKAADAMLKVGYSYLQLGDAVNARSYFEALLKYYPSAKPATLAREKLSLL